jgi:UDP-N-acetylmuramyl pentapeptide phosphotransferase/UDP-N-acetylglucosamine-1-phosphate transferase
MIFLLFVSFIVSMAAAVLLIRWARDHTKHYDADKPQRFHVGDVPRLGGVAILLGMLVGWAFAAVSARMGWAMNTQLSPEIWLGWTLMILPAVCGGAFEDATQRLSIWLRLLLTGVSAALACGLLGISVPRLAIPGVDQLLLASPWLGVGIAVFAICGLPHAFNIIDGYNGLAGTVAVMIALALAHVALQVGDRELAVIVLCMVGATGGFLLWNYPRGMIFAGDGGAYLWGVVIAVASIALVHRHEAVSPWFPMLLLMYPVWETVFSIYRKAVRGVSPGVADALHFHQLIYRRLVRGVFHDDHSRRVLMRNNRTSPYLWGFTLLTVAPAVLFWNRTLALMACCFLFAAFYVTAYLMLVRFKTPKWLVSRH